MAEQEAEWDRRWHGGPGMSVHMEGLSLAWHSQSVACRPAPPEDAGGSGSLAAWLCSPMPVFCPLSFLTSSLSFLLLLHRAAFLHHPVGHQVSVEVTLRSYQLLDKASLPAREDEARLLGLV